MRILAIRVGRVGDTVMMTPALTALLNCYPDASLTILASPEGKSLLNNYHPRVEDIWVWNRYGLGIRSHFDRKRLTRKIGESDFDLIFCFDTNPSMAGLASESKAEIYLQTVLGPPVHCARHYLNLIEQAYGKAIDDIPVNLPVSPESVEQLDVELEQMGIRPDDTLIMFHPTFSGYSRLGLRKRDARKRKLWPAENYAELARRLYVSAQDHTKNLRIIMALLPAEQSLGRKIANLSKGCVTLLVSQPGFERYKALIHRANLFVTPDTGPMHIAAAVDTRTVAMFSNKDPADCGPYMKPGRYTILRTELTEEPERGIAAIKVDDVVEACIGQLAADAGES